MRLMPPKFQYVHCDIPEGMSIREWRDQQHPRRHPHRSRLRRLLVLVRKPRDPHVDARSAERDPLVL
jgi:hypothetical protein